jgi:hypothetical protein
MCKYCRHLQKVIKDDQACIDNWRAYVYKCDKVMNSASKMLLKFIQKYDVCREDQCDAELLIDVLLRLVDVDYVGK